MASFLWTDHDLQQMRSLGIDPSEADRQLNLFKNPPPYISLNRPATLGDGILRLSEGEAVAAEKSYREARRLGRFQKFVPASGAATRMFFSLRQFLDKGVVRRSQLESPDAGPEAVLVLELMTNLPHLAFYNDLCSALEGRGIKAADLLLKGDYGPILETLLSEKWMDYSRKAKGLIQFHSHPGERRTALTEHLIEAVRTVRDNHGICRVHFTVAGEQLDEFRKGVEQVRITIEKDEEIHLEVGFSTQNSGLDTLAVDLEGNPFRLEQGDLVFRPAGHGALIDNLNDLGGDLVFIKNIDNVAVGRYLEITVEWKKKLAGFLARLQEELFQRLRRLSQPGASEAILAEAIHFAGERLGLKLIAEQGKENGEQKRIRLLETLNRPLRVCGMVPNQGEAGGGPFWVEGVDGQISLQIVESAQVDHRSAEQRGLFKGSSHFNPVDLVCAVRDWEGKPFQLKKFVDPSAVFISRKSIGGRELKALELPGLWNGAMAGWITLFVEVPLETFNPVKTVFDLMKPAHRARV